jgi:8-oxo-dGTP diphosphatase
VTAGVTGPSDPIPVVCAIIEQSGLILACRRGPRQSNAGLWEFPGGKIRQGESPKTALIREIREELGVSVEPRQQLTPVIHTYPWIVIRLIPFECGLKKGDPYPHEHSEIRWVDRNTAMALEWAPADRPILEEYYSLNMKEGAVREPPLKG